MKLEDLPEDVRNNALRKIEKVPPMHFLAVARGLRQMADGFEAASKSENPEERARVLLACDEQFAEAVRPIMETYSEASSAT